MPKEFAGDPESIQLEEFKVLGRLAHFGVMAERLAGFAKTEMALYVQLKDVVAGAAKANLGPYRELNAHQSLVNPTVTYEGVTQITTHGPIDYNPDPTDSSKRRFIVIEEAAHTLRGGINGSVLSNTPRLMVFTEEGWQKAFHPRDDEYVPYPADFAEVCIDRSPLETMTGFENGLLLEELVEAFIQDTPGNNRLVLEQAEYGLWLNRASEVLELSPHYTMLPTIQITEPGVN